MLSPNGCWLFVGTSNGSINIWTMDDYRLVYSVCVFLAHRYISFSLVASIQVSEFSITCCEWDSTNRLVVIIMIIVNSLVIINPCRYLMVGTAGGEVVCYSLDSQHVVYSKRICYGSVNCTKWITLLRHAATMLILIIIVGLIKGVWLLDQVMGVSILY